MRAGVIKAGIATERLKEAKRGMDTRHRRGCRGEDRDRAIERRLPGQSRGNGCRCRGAYRE